MPFLSDLDPADLHQLLASWGEKPSHALRLLRTFYRLGGQLPLPMDNIGRQLQHRIASELLTRQARIRQRSDSADGTVKLLLELSGGATTETVLMPSIREDRAAGCVSSQVGCAMRCDFCASTRHGMLRDLSAGEIVEQFLFLNALSRESSRRLSTIVFMGMGEPMLNLDAVITAIGRMKYLGVLGGRHITVSTVGIVPGIERLASADLGVHLALSLHAPDDDTRNRIVPMTRRYCVGDIVAAAREFQLRTGRIVTIEYCLLAGVNDAPGQARLLASLIDGFRFHVNLIPYNSIGVGLSGTVYQRPDAVAMARFHEILTEHGVVAHFRQTRGDDVAAACGQLRSDEVERAKRQARLNLALPIRQ